MRGEWKQGGWWSYYAYGLLVTLPHGTQLMMLLACLVIASETRRNKWQGLVRVVPLLLPLLALFLLVSSQTAFSTHFRYVLPCIGLGLVLAGAVAASHPKCALICVVLSAASWVPQSSNGIGYLNEVSRGLGGDQYHLQGSSLEWGQDFLPLVKWSETLPSGELLYIDCKAKYSIEDIGVRGATADLSKATWLVVGAERRSKIKSKLYRSLDDEQISETICGEPEYRFGRSIFVFRNNRRGG